MNNIFYKDNSVIIDTKNVLRNSKQKLVSEQNLHLKDRFEEFKKEATPPKEIKI